MTPAAILRTLVKPLSPAEREPLEAAGIDPRLIRRAALGQQVNAAAHLRLCALLGLDPVGGETIPVRPLGELFWPSLGAALHMRRIELKLNMRETAREARMSSSAIFRIERAEPVSIEAVLAACKWLGRHPFDFVSPEVSRVTPDQRSAAPTPGGPNSLHARVRSSRAHRKVPITLATTVRT